MRIMSFLAGVMSGAVVGATAALLLAPSSGEELRIDTRLRYETIVQDARRAAAQKQAELEDQLARLRRPKPASEAAS